MKKISILLAIFLLAGTMFVVNAKTDTETGKRFLKLGMSYLQSGNYTKAANYLKKGKSIASQHNNTYWEAVADEYYAYLYHSLGQTENAKSSLNNAINKYNKIIKQRDGSPYALEEVKENLHNIIQFGDINKYGIDNSSNILNFDNKKINEILSHIPDKVINISLSNCRIKNLYFIADFTDLEYLNLSNNRIKELPKNISELIKLKYLDLSNNRLKTIPVEEIHKLSNLKILNLKGNKLNFEDIINLVRMLPNTNIFTDNYIKEIEEDE